MCAHVLLKAAGGGHSLNTRHFVSLCPVKWKFGVARVPGNVGIWLLFGGSSTQPARVHAHPADALPDAVISDAMETGWTQWKPWLHWVLG